MRVVLLGAPGSGKGTQAELIVQRYGMVHLSTGQILRDEVGSGSALGRELAAIMEAGELVSDEIILRVVSERLKTAPSAGFLLDGFPRTLFQAQALDQVLTQVNQPLDAVIFLDVDYREIMQRLLSRQRPDDKVETIRKRLEVYEQQTSPLVDFYKAKGNLYEIHGVGSITQIASKIANILDDCTAS